MPFPSPRSHVSGCVVLPVEAPCDIVFEALCDVDKFPSMSPNILSIEILGSIDIPQVGSKWKETRLFRGGPLKMIKTVRELSDLSVTVDVAFEEGSRWDTSHSNESLRLTVEPIEEKDDPSKRCRVVLSMGFVADGLAAYLMTTLICGYCIRRYAKKYMRQELQYFAVEAEKRYQESNAKGA